MPCVLCADLFKGVLPCNAKTEFQILESAPVHFRKDKSIRMLLNLMDGCPCKECIVNSKCNSAFNCEPFKTKVKDHLSERLLNILDEHNL